MAQFIAITVASAALAFSEIPFQKTLAGVRIGYVDGEIVINPTYEPRHRSTLDIAVAVADSMDGLVMVEAGAKEVSADIVVRALAAAVRAAAAAIAVRAGRYPSWWPRAPGTPGARGRLPHRRWSVPPAPDTIRERLSRSAARLKDWRARMAPQVLARRSLAPLLLGLLGLFCAGDAGLAQDTPQRPLAITITAHKYEFSQARIDVTQDDVIRITLVAEDIPHSFIVDDYRIAKRAAPGKPITFEFRADKAGTFPFYCNLTIDDGCRTMRGELVVAPRPR